MVRISLLQVTLLQELQSEPAKSVTELASRVDKLRPSVSRSLKLLRQQGLVTYEGRKWQVTPSGQEEADRAKEKLQELGARFERTFKVLAPRTPISVLPPRTLRALDSFSARMDAILPRVQAASEVIRTNSAAFQQLHASHVEAISRAIGPLAQAQSHHAALIKGTVGTRLLPDISSLMQAYNQNLAKAVGDGLALRSLESSRLPELPLGALSGFAPISVHLPAIAEAVEALGRHLPSHLEAPHGVAPSEDTVITVVTPPAATAAYTRSIRLWIEEDSPAGPAEAYHPLRDPHSHIHGRLAELGPQLVEKHQGAWHALWQGGPDSLRHAAVSMRELLRVVFKHLVPDEDLGGEGTTRLRARVRHFLNDSESSAQFATHMALGLDGLFDRLNAYTHGDETDRAALQGLMTAADGVLLFILHHTRHSSE